MNAGPLPILAPAGPCPRSPDEGPHAWQLGDMADLVSHGHPDHGLTVWLGRCQHCTTSLLAVTRLDAEDADGAPWYEVTGSEL
ncbi:MAG TPA: hypothetical protein VLJ59_14475 [Mycobacteriales bacterium]|nr:hypothetical protein [Mycobacteriales bacterium]